jgi:hypothetical protein
MGPAEQRTETPLHTGAALPVIQVPAQSSEMPRAPERYGPKTSARTLAPGATPLTWKSHNRGPQIGSEYPTSESPALTFTCSQRRPPPTVISLLIPNGPPATPRNESVSRATKNPRSPRRLTLAFGLMANRAGVMPTASTPKPVAADSSTLESARALGQNTPRARRASPPTCIVLIRTGEDEEQAGSGRQGVHGDGRAGGIGRGG